MNADSQIALWDGLLAFLRARHGGLVRSWFTELESAGLNAGVLAVRASRFEQLRYLNDHCFRPFVDAAQAVTGRLVSILFVGPDGQPYTPPKPEGEETPNAYPLKLNPDYTLDNFVIGPSNQLAHAAATAVADNLGRTYNPLYLHGDVGLGKTHLLQAICHRLLDQRPDLRVAYLTCETFTGHFIDAVEKGALNSFRYRYRNVDTLIIDDIQFLTIGDRCQEEFFHTFNTLYQDQRQIVLTADCQPAAIPGLEERLSSRFGWGLVARLDALCPETRIAIVRKKARMRGFELPDEVAALIGNQIDSNARELEGALARICSQSKLNDGKISLDLAKAALTELRPPARQPLRIEKIMEIVMQHYGVRMADMQSRRRSKSIALPRQVCMHLARRLTPHSLEEIGGYFGGRDHTTVLHADRTITQRRTRDRDLGALLDRLEGELRR